MNSQITCEVEFDMVLDRIGARDSGEDPVVVVALKSGQVVIGKMVGYHRIGGTHDNSFVLEAPVELVKRLSDNQRNTIIVTEYMDTYRYATSSEDLKYEFFWKDCLYMRKAGERAYDMWIRAMPDLKQAAKIDAQLK